MRHAPILALLLLCFAGCNAASADAAAPTPNPGPIERGHAFAQAHCSGCHAVAPPAVSPNPEAPPFEEVVARPGLTRETLGYWLRNSHNFPEMMDFEIDPGQVDDLADYMMTLRKAG